MRDPWSALAAIGRHRLAHLPTPLEELPRLTEALKGPRLLVKRDDCTGLGRVGNKTRNPAFLLDDALERRAHTMLSTGDVTADLVRQPAPPAQRRRTPSNHVPNPAASWC